MARRGYSQRPNDFLLSSDAPLAQGLMFAGLGRFPGSNLYFDSTKDLGRGNHGSLINTPPPTTWVERLGRRGVLFGGNDSGDHILLGQALSFASVPWTFSAWVDLNSVYSFNGFFGNAVTTDAYTRLIGVSNSTTQLYNDANEGATLSSDLAVGLRHYVLTYDGAACREYRNGKLTSGPVSLAGTFTFLRLGNYGTSGATEDALDGALFDVLIHDRLLTANEIGILSDPGNVMLEGLVIPPGRMAYSYSASEPSSSPSSSPTSSPSVSPSASPSASPSSSPSTSPSASPSSSPSVSPSSSPALTEIYSKGDYASLPTGIDDLENAFTAQEYLDVDSDDNVYVSQTAASSEYTVFQFKDRNTNDALDQINITCVARSNVAPSSSSVKLQIYNRTTETWADVDTESAAEADTEFTLSGEISSSLDSYYDDDYRIVCRVYQQNA